MAETLQSTNPLANLSRDAMHELDLRDALDALRDRLAVEGVRFAVIGALAMRQHRYSRFTEDIDIVTTREGLDRIHARLVGLQVPVGITHVQHFGAVRHIHAAVADRDTRRDEQVVREDRRFVGYAVVVRVLQNRDRIAGILPRRNVRIDGAADNPQAAVVVPSHVDRLGDHRVSGEKIDFEAVGHMEGFHFFIHVRRWNL